MVLDLGLSEIRCGGVCVLDGKAMGTNGYSMSFGWMTSYLRNDALFELSFVLGGKRDFYLNFSTPLRLDSKYFN